MITRRSLTKLLGSMAASTCIGSFAQESTPDYRLEIAPLALEIGPKKIIKTTAYNGQVPGPLLRLREGSPVTIEIANRTIHPEVVHWHGLFLPPEVDGASEEGTPMIAPGATTRVHFTPRPAGFRWFHTHTMAMNDLTRGQYSGQHGFLLIEPRDQAARYDQEFFLALHDWGGQLLPTDDGSMNPAYDHSTINGKVMGAGEPLRVKQGQRVLLHVLNSSATEVHWIALAGHQLEVVALDGNPIPTSTQVAMLRLAPAERVCALVEMNNPGVWVLGEVRKHVQAAGMAIAVEYAGQTGKPQWQQPADRVWDYAAFSAPPETDPKQQAESVIDIPLVIESKFRGHGAMEGYTINGKSYPQTTLPALKQDQRYRLQFINRSVDDHPMHLHRHSFELRRLGAPLKPGRGQAKVVSGLMKDTVMVAAETQTDVEFTARNPGATLLHCHQQNHMDLGFMVVLRYE